MMERERPHETPPLRFVDRPTGAVLVEPVFRERALRFIHETRLGRCANALLLSRRAFSVCFGGLDRLRRTRRKIPDFIRSLGIDPTEADRPLEDYRSLDDFFTRRLKPEARPIDRDPAHLVSPADGRVLVLPRLDGDRFSVKASSVTLAELLGDARLADRYLGGTGFIIRLAPADYHRFHFPDSGEAGPSSALGRRLYSVHPIALATGAPSFRNRRVISHLDTEAFGRLTLIEIGAQAVGTILETYHPGRVDRGAEKGYFRFGGSTVVLLAEPGRILPDVDLVRASTRGVEVQGGTTGPIETLVRMGTRIACRA